MCLASLAFSFSTVFTWENIFFAHLLVCRPLPHGELLQRGPAVRTARLFCLHSRASPADAMALALGMEVGIAASWRCLSSIFLPGAWHTPHQKDTLLSSALLCSPLLGRLQHFVGKSNYLTTSLSSSQWLTLETQFNIFFLPHAIKDHKLPALFLASGFGWG